MLRGGQPTLSGKWYQVHDAMNHPAPLSRIPVMIGGAGERKTLRMAAQYADESNLICGVDEIPRKLEVLAGHCANLGRERSEITVSYQTSACIAPTHEQAVSEFEDYLARQPEAEARRGTAIVGSPDEVAGQFARLRDTGIDGVTVNAPPNGHIEGRVALLGETLAPLFTS
jgi:alkanesulfonate monooxygenase SsuD/methylene tetrahydromethanopterin reductase-like flavin-dependent oxidoreductase (luciferase family)